MLYLIRTVGIVVWLLLSQGALYAGAELFGLTRVGSDSLMGTGPQPVFSFPNNAAIHLPPGTPAYSAGTRTIFRNDTGRILEVGWGGLFDDGTDGIGSAVFQDGAGARYWNWFYYGGTHPSGLSWSQKRALVLPGDYLIELEGGLTHLPASGWSIRVESGGEVDAAFTKIVRFQLMDREGLSEHCEVIDARLAALPKTSRQTSISSHSGIDLIEVTAMASNLAIPSGGWRVRARLRELEFGDTVVELGRFEVSSGGSIDGRVVVQAYPHLVGSSPEHVFPGPANPLDPGQEVRLVGVGFRTGWEALGAWQSVEALGVGWPERVWQTMPRLGLASAMRTALAPFQATTRSGRAPDRWELVSGPGMLSANGDGTFRLRVLDDSADIVVRPSVGPGRDGLGNQWEGSLADASALLTITVRRQLTVRAGSLVHTYDGTAPQLAAAAVSGRLRTGHVCEPRVAGSGSNAGTYPVTPSARIRDAVGTLLHDTATQGSVSDLYRITLVPGSLEIRPAVVEGTLVDLDRTGAFSLTAADLSAVWRVPATPSLKPVGSTSLQANSPAGSVPLTIGSEVLPDDYAVTASFVPSSPNYAPAQASGRLRVRMPIQLRGENASVSVVDATGASIPANSLAVLPGSTAVLSAEPAPDFAWGSSWEDSAPRIWQADREGVLESSSATSAKLSFVVPRRVREAVLTARAAQVPPRLHAFAAASTTASAILLGRATAALQFEGECREGPLAGFDLQIRAPDEAVFSESLRVPVPAQSANGARVRVKGAVQWQPGRSLLTHPLVPERVETRAGKPWELRARAVTQTGRVGPWTPVSAVAEAPLRQVDLRLRNVPPDGELAEWFEASDEVRLPLLVWMP